MFVDCFPEPAYLARTMLSRNTYLAAFLCLAAASITYAIVVM